MKELKMKKVKTKEWKMKGLKMKGVKTECETELTSGCHILSHVVIVDGLIVTVLVAHVLTVSRPELRLPGQLIIPYLW